MNEECAADMVGELARRLRERLGEDTQVRRDVRAGKFTRVELERVAEKEFSGLTPTFMEKGLSNRLCGDTPWRANVPASTSNFETIYARGDARAPGASSTRPAIEIADLRARIVSLAVDEVLSEAMYPGILLPISPVQLPDSPVHALVFSAFPHVCNELFPLMVDAFVAQCETGADFQVLGVHEEWLREGRVTRGIFFDDERDVLVEADIENCPPVISAQVLALNLREEAASHQRIERKLPGTAFFNPYAGARALDSKAETGAIWREAGLATPRCIAVSGGGNFRALIGEFLESATCNVVLKPTDGTEGRGVRIFRAGEADEIADTVARGGEWLLCDAHGSVRYENRAATVRVNVVFDGEVFRAESGYAQVAVSADGVASVGRGGEIVPMTRCWSGLTHDGGAIFPTSDDWCAVVAMAEQGAAALFAKLGAYMPRLVGIDLLLDFGGGLLHPILLEANPRPAGMCHSRFFSPDGPSDEPGVSISYWRMVNIALK